LAKAAAQRMSVIALVMGKQAARSQLIPYVTEKVGQGRAGAGGGRG
jgi:hypothetical protein